MIKTKKNSKYKSIGEVAKILNLVNNKKSSFSTHTIRFWEKEFKQVKPKFFFGKRRYYDDASIDILKKIKYLLKVKGMTLKGAKKVLNEGDSDIDELYNTSITQRNYIKSKINNIKNILKILENKNG